LVEKGTDMTVDPSDFVEEEMTIEVIDPSEVDAEEITVADDDTD
jgi:hypothetical protein